MMTEDGIEVEHTDLVYSGRNRKRPPGASDLVQRIYTLLSEHPEGMTRDDIWKELREGWLDTDAYRAYEKRRDYYRTLYQVRLNRPVELRPRAEYGSSAFKNSAQRWWIRTRLDSMVDSNTARRENDRWYTGTEVPHGWVPCKIKGGHLVPLDVKAQQAAYQADTQSHVRREQIKARLREELLAKRPKRISAREQRMLETIDLTYEYLSGR